MINAAPAITDRYVAEQFVNLQYRQELHDRLYHTDIYTLDKHHRLVHLVLHHCKYVAHLHVTVQEYGVDGDENIHANNRRRMENLAVDGIIVCMSMMNCCNHQIGAFMDTAHWDKDTPLYLLIRHMGTMSKTVEDVDHMGQTNPLKSIIESVEVMLAAYFKLFERGGGDFHYLTGRIHQRLTEVEKKSIFFDRLDIEMDKLLRQRR